MSAPRSNAWSAPLGSSKVKLLLDSFQLRLTQAQTEDLEKSFAEEADQKRTRLAEINSLKVKLRVTRERAAREADFAAQRVG